MKHLKETLHWYKGRVRRNVDLDLWKQGKISKEVLLDSLAADMLYSIRRVENMEVSSGV